MKKVSQICLFICVFVLLVTVCSPVSAEINESIENGAHSVDAKRPLDGNEKLLDTSKAVIVYELRSDTLIYAYNPDQKVDPSSMVKLMTALIAIENVDLSETAIVSRAALDHVGIGVVSVSPRFSRDEILTIEDLLYCMVAASDSDSAAVLAEYIAGSQSAFVQMMNERAQQMGCMDTNFTNAHGLYDENAYSTVRDLCRILDVAMENPVFKTVFTTKSYTVPATNKAAEREVLTTNWMMSKDYTSRYYDARVTGGKTATDGNGGRCLAVTAEQNGMELLAIVMGADPVYNVDNPNVLEAFGSFEEMKMLLDHVCELYEYRQVFYENQTFSQHPVNGGSNYVVTTPSYASAAVLPIGTTSEQLRWVYGDMPDSLNGPIAAGEKVSHVEVWYRDLCIAQTDLLAMNAVNAPILPEEPQLREESPLEEEGVAVLLVILGVLAGVVVLIVVVLLVIRMIRIAAMQTRRRRKSRRRRR